MAPGDGVHGGKQVLVEVPAADVTDNTVVLVQGNVLEIGRSRIGDAQPLLAEQSPCQGPVAEKFNVVGEAEVFHAVLGTAVGHRVLDLVGDDVCARIDHLGQLRNVEVGSANVPDRADLLEVLEDESNVNAAVRPGHHR